MVKSNLDKIILKYFPDAKFKTSSEFFSYTEIIHFKAKGLNLVAKLICHEVLSQYSESKRQILFNDLFESTSQYYLALKKIGIKVPKYHKLIIEDEKLVEFATDLGEQRLDRILKSSPSGQVPKILDSYVRSILPAVTQKKPVIGFDATAENLFYTDKKEFTYCDFVPARMKYKGQYLVGFPQPLDKKEISSSYERYYLPYGILRRARIFLLNTNPDFDEIFFNALKNNLAASKFKKIKSQFEKTDEFKIKKFIVARELNKAIKTINKITDIDTLREVSAWIYWLLKKQTTPLDVYDLTRIKFYLSKSERLKRIKLFKKTIIGVMDSSI